MGKYLCLSNRRYTHNNDDTDKYEIDGLIDINR